jgi:hypothetical protein
MPISMKCASSTVIELAVVAVTVSSPRVPVPSP